MSLARQLVSRRTRELPRGKVTFCFTDIEGSTQLFARLGPRFLELLESHSRIIRAVAGANGGVEVRSEGDGFLLAFPEATEAISAAIGLQRELAEHAWPEGGRVTVRLGKVRTLPYRPEVIGGLFAWHPDDLGFSLSAYFTSEADARRGENLDEFKSFFEDLSAVMQDVTYIDLREPWLSSRSAQIVTPRGGADRNEASRSRPGAR